MPDSTTKLELERMWSLGEQLGGGGFGQVFAAECDGMQAAAKLIPKDPGAQRELLFVDMSGVRNVVPIIDSGERDDAWVLVMPRASRSLRDFLVENGGSLDEPTAVKVLKDIVDALVDLSGRVVHRDLKPENVLFLDGHWCLADFGISRYAEATTAVDTRKFALTPAYAAPERWRAERAEAASDIYSVGVIAHEVLAGVLPFPGPHYEDFREQHLHSEIPQLEGIPPQLASLVGECLLKAPGSRPTPASLRARLDSALPTAASPAGLARLRQANLAEVSRKGAADQQASMARTAAERRDDLMKAAESLYEKISAALLSAVTDAAPTVGRTRNAGGAWTLRLGDAELGMSAVRAATIRAGGGGFPFNVVAAASIKLRVPSDSYGYSGRGHSIWYGDVQVEDDYGWHETAFMFMPLMAAHQAEEPFALEPGPEALQAVGPGVGTHQVGWPFTPLVVGALDDFVGRWAGWLADAAQGHLHHPMSMPEIPPEGSWRRS